MKYNELTKSILALIAIAALTVPALAQLPPPTEEAAHAFNKEKTWSPYAEPNFPTEVYFGDTHLHTGMSMDAGAFGEAKAQDSWTEVGGYLFVTGVSGGLEVGGFKSDVDVPFGDVVENLDIGAVVLIEHRRGDWMFMLDVAYGKLGIDSSASAGPLTVDVSSEAAQAVVEGFIGHRVYKYYEGETLKSAIDVLAGVRYNYFDLKISSNVSALGANAQASLHRTLSFADPVIGARYRHHINDKWGVTLYADVGGFGVGSKITYQVTALVNYDLQNDYRLYAGVRYLHFTYEDDTRFGDLVYEANYLGPIIGLSKRF